MSNLMELLKAKKQAMSANRRAKTVKIPLNSSRWRILPGWDPKNPVFYHDFGQHFIKDAAGELKAVYVCVDKTYGKPCQVCSALSHAIKNTTDDAMLEILGEAKSTGRVLLNALRIDSENPGDPVVIEIPPSVFEGIMNLMLEWEADKVLDLKSGMDILIERTGTGKLTKYSVQIASRSQPVDPSVMKRVTNLEEYVAQESEENARKALENVNAVAGVFAPVARGVLAAPKAEVAPALAALRDITPEVEVEESTSTEDEEQALRELEISVAPAEVAVSPKGVGAKPAKPATVAAPVPEATGDEALDAMIAELERGGSV